MAPWTIEATAQRSPNVTIKMTSATVKNFFAELKKQTGLDFICSTDLAESLPKVSLNAQDKPVREVLDEVMDKLNCSYSIEGNIVTIKKRQAGNMLTGRVVDENGEALVGVSVHSRHQRRHCDRQRRTLRAPRGSCTERKERQRFLSRHENTDLAYASPADIEGDYTRTRRQHHGRRDRDWLSDHIEGTCHRIVRHHDKQAD